MRTCLPTTRIPILISPRHRVIPVLHICTCTCIIDTYYHCIIITFPLCPTRYTFRFLVSLHSTSAIALCEIPIEKAPMVMNYVHQYPDDWETLIFWNATIVQPSKITLLPQWIELQFTLLKLVCMQTKHSDLCVEGGHGPTNNAKHFIHTYVARADHCILVFFQPSHLPTSVSICVAYGSH